jgi:hypothetical protein
MARRQLVVARSAQVRSNKRNRRRGERKPTARPSEPGFTELEQAFFASAPPDQPAPHEAPECFDDLGPRAAPAPDPLAAVARALSGAWAAIRSFLFELTAGPPARVTTTARRRRG